MENWKKFRETFYEISDLGRIRNILTNRILKSFVNKKGYHRIKLKMGEKRHQFSVYRLVAEVFITDKLDGLEVDHINRDKDDNRLINLRVVTRKENLENRRPKLTSKEHIEFIVNLHKNGLTIDEIYNQVLKM
jgi:hypothetical protein